MHLKYLKTLLKWLAYWADSLSSVQYHHVVCGHFSDGRKLCAEFKPLALPVNTAISMVDNHDYSIWQIPKLLFTFFTFSLCWSCCLCVSCRGGRWQGPVQARREAVGSRVSTHQQTDRPIPSGGTVRPFTSDLYSDDHLTKRIVSYSSMLWTWFLQAASTSTH